MSPDIPSADKAELVTDDGALASVVKALDGAEAYAIDTEFHRERTYFPQLALVQIAWPGGLVLIDPLAVDVKALAPVFASASLAVVHAADQDLEVLELTVGTVPAQMFDTQVAAGFLGMSTPSLSSLCERFVGVHLPKAERLTDWLARPLGDRQRRYAASDVIHLLAVRDLQRVELEQRGRLGWAEEEIELRRTRASGPRDPALAWTRIKEVRQLKGTARCVAIEVAAWRERRAAETDQPVRFVLPDMAVVTIAQRAPRTREELAALRGVDGRHTGGGAAASLLEAVVRGLEAKPVKAAPPPAELDRSLRPAVALVTAWISQLGRDLEIDPSLLATRADIEAVLRADPDARLSTGWRADLMGQRIRDLVEGRAALAFEGEGRLVLEERG
jgi:ribonuclease D